MKIKLAGCSEKESADLLSAIRNKMSKLPIDSVIEELRNEASVDGTTGHKLLTGLKKELLNKKRTKKQSKGQNAK